MARHLRDAVIACAALALLPVAQAAAQTSSGTGSQGTGTVQQPSPDTRGQATRNSVGSDVDADLRKADQDIKEAEKDVDRSPWLRENVRKLTDQ